MLAEDSWFSVDSAGFDSSVSVISSVGTGTSWLSGATRVFAEDSWFSVDSVGFDSSVSVISSVGAGTSWFSTGGSTEGESSYGFSNSSKEVLEGMETFSVVVSFAVVESSVVGFTSSIGSDIECRREGRRGEAGTVRLTK